MASKRKATRLLQPSTRPGPAHYVERSKVDDEFRKALERRFHIIVFGGPDTGKTSLTRRYLGDQCLVRVQCSSKMKLFDVYRLVVSEANISLTVHERKKKSKTQTATVHVASEAAVVVTESVEVPFQIDLSNIRDVIRLLEQKTKVRSIVLEDFHNLKWKIQRSVVHDLKVAFETSNITFVIIGIWHDSDRLSLLSADIVGRCALIDTECWTTETLRTIVHEHEKGSGSRFGPTVVDELLSACSLNAGILADLTQRGIAAYGQLSKEEQGQLATPPGARRFVKVCAAAMLADYRSFYQHFVSRFWARRSDERSRAAAVIVKELFTARPAMLRNGLTLKMLKQRAMEWFPRKGYWAVVNRVESVLENVEAFQRKRGVRPPILTYDRREEVLRVVDARFALFLKSVFARENEERVTAAIEAWRTNDRRAAANSRRQQREAEARATQQVPPTASSAGAAATLPLMQSEQRSLSSAASIVESTPSSVVGTEHMPLSVIETSAADVPAAVEAPAGSNGSLAPS